MDERNAGTTAQAPTPRAPYSPAAVSAREIDDLIEDSSLAEPGHGADRGPSGELVRRTLGRGGVPAPDAVPALRRVPVQGRSVARVQRMLDACAELVDEVGYEGLTTTLLAERAEVAIGSVYQFFPDKRAIVQALAMRNMDAYLQSLSDRFGSETFAHWWDGVDAAIDAYIDMHRRVPGFRTLHFGDVVDVHLLDVERDNNAVIADRLAELLVDQFQLMDRARLRFALQISVEAADALIKLAFRRDQSGDESVLTEAKALIREYLHRHVIS